MPSEYLSENLAFEMTKVTSEGDKKYLYASLMYPLLMREVFQKNIKESLKNILAIKISLATQQKRI